MSTNRLALVARATGAEPRAAAALEMIDAPTWASFYETDETPAVEVAVEFSSLNFKDALARRGIRESPDNCR